MVDSVFTELYPKGAPATHKFVTSVLPWSWQYSHRKKKMIKKKNDRKNSSLVKNVVTLCPHASLRKTVSSVPDQASGVTSAPSPAVCRSAFAELSSSTSPDAQLYRGSTLYDEPTSSHR